MNWEHVTDLIKEYEAKIAEMESDISGEVVEEDDGSNDEPEEENIVMTIDYNFDAEEDVKKYKVEDIEHSGYKYLDKYMEAYLPNLVEKMTIEGDLCQAVMYASDEVVESRVKFEIERFNEGVEEELKKFESQIKKFEKICSEARKKSLAIKINLQSRDYILPQYEWKFIQCYTNKFGSATILFNGMDVAHYESVEMFKKVVSEFEKAIKRGDEEFTFPAHVA